VHRDGQVRGASTHWRWRDLLGRYDEGSLDDLDAAPGPHRDGAGIDCHDLAQRIRDTVLDTATDHSAHSGPESVDWVWVCHGGASLSLDVVLLRWLAPRKTLSADYA
jgi:hypothetical protein